MLVEIRFPPIFLLLSGHANESVSKIRGVVWKLPEMLYNRFCIFMGG